MKEGPDISGNTQGPAAADAAAATPEWLHKQQRGSRWLVRLGVIMQVAITSVVAAGIWMGWGSLERSFRRGVTAAAAQSAAEWSLSFQGLAAALSREELGRLTREARGLKHAIPEEAAIDVVFTRPSNDLPEEAWRRQAVEQLRSGKEEWWEFVGGRIEGGLRYARAVTWEESCGGCHESAQPRAVAGFLSIVHPTPRMSQILKYRRLDLLVRQGVSFLVWTVALWLVLAIAVRQMRRAEAQIRALFKEVSASEQRYRALVDNALVGVYIIQNDRFAFVNRRACEVMGYTMEEALTTIRVLDIVAPEDREIVIERLRERLSAEVPSLHYEFMAVRKDGTRIPVEVFGSLVMLATGPAVQGMFIDNSERRASERALDAAYRAVVGLPGLDVFAAAAESLSSLLQVPVVLICRLIGTEIEVVASHGPLHVSTRIPLAGCPSEMVVLRQEPVSIEQGLRAEFPGNTVWVGTDLQSYFGWPLMGGDGDVLGVLAALDTQPRTLTEIQQQILDMHAVRLGRELERQRHEERSRELEQRLMQSQKLEALGILAGGIAHDFNNVLTGIAGTAEVLLRTLPPGRERERAGTVLQLSQRGGEVVSKILAFARSEVPTAQAVDLNAAVSDAITLGSHSLGPHIRLESELDPALPTVDGDAPQLQQVVVNLLLNARDAMPEGGRVRVRTRKAADDGEVVLEVEDDGCGIPPDVLPHIFEPFFSTKPFGRGTGLGLSMVHRTITSHGGSVKVESLTSGGTRMSIRLPRGRLPASVPSRPVINPPEPALSVLLVDDEEAIVESVGELLAIEGYRVLQAENASAALELWEREEDRIDVALLDIAMPGMSGVELARRLRDRKPTLPLVFSSGHPTQGLGAEFLGHPSIAFVQKPYSASELLRALQRVMPRRDYGNT
ncbi:MAG: response regulator [Acidobacteria bacterium]|nr:response regulator [Acidobacteriota bacterium]